MKIGVVGASGRMGRMLLAEVLGAPDCRLAGAVEAPGHPAVGRPAGELLSAPAMAAAAARPAAAEALAQPVGDDPVALFAAVWLAVEALPPLPKMRTMRSARHASRRISVNRSMAAASTAPKSDCISSM